MNRNKSTPELSPIRNNTLKLISWNIHDIQTRDEGVKTNMSDYTTVAKGANFVCLQETKQPIKIKGYP